jgi:hypothetical protein
MIELLQRSGCFALLTNSFSDLEQLRLMNFIRRIGRDEIYIKYVHQLVNVSLVHQTPAPSNIALCRCTCKLRTMWRQP